ncbi:MAG: tetratricopeptide repeat protein [Phycisphaerae bacterium]
MAPVSKTTIADQTSMSTCAPTVSGKDRPLPVLPSRTGVQPSKMSKWRAAVLIGIHVLIAIHVAHWLNAGSTVSPIEPSEAMEFSKHGIINAGVVFFGLAILSTAIFGRFVCGWACHLIALQDLSRWLLGKIGLRPKPFRSRLLVLVPLGAFVYMYLYPVAYRLWVGDDLGYRASALTTSRFWASFPGITVAVMTLGTCGFAIIYFLGSKGFCNYACPYGGVFRIMDRLAPGRIRVTDACSGCGHCTVACSSNVRVHQQVRDYGMVVDSKCMKCHDCVSVCPEDALYFGFGKPALLAGAGRPSTARRRYDYTWPEELMLAGFFLAGLFVFRGLYGLVPFLFSLGLSGILAFVSVQFVRLAYKPAVTIQRWTLKRAGRVQRGGKVFGVCVTAIWVFWAHSGVVQYHTRSAQWVYDRLVQARHDLLDFEREESDVPEEYAQLAARGLHHARRARAWSLSPAVPPSRQLAWFSLLSGDPEGFDRYMNEAQTRAPGDGGIAFDWGSVLAAQGRLEPAVEQLRRAVALDPGSAGIPIRLGMTLARMGRVADGLNVFEAALAQHPDNATLCFNYGVLEASVGRNESAVRRFQRALALDEEFIEARENLAGMLCATGRFEEGIEHFRAALRVHPEDAQTHQLLARAYLATGAWESAKSELEEVVRLDPGRLETYRLLARLHASLGDMEAAERYLSMAAAGEPG